MSDALDLRGGPAFPVSISGVGDNGCAGMSLRDWFASQVMDRMMALCQDRDGGWDASAVAAGCYQVADAMLAERDDRRVSEDELLAALRKDLSP